MNERVKKSYESTVMRMAGNIAAGYVGALAAEHAGYPDTEATRRIVAMQSVRLARAIVAEVLRTEVSEAGQ